MKIPVVKPDAGVQFVVGAGDVPQHVPRAEMEAGIPSDVTFAPSVAPVVVMDVAVGEVTVGTAGIATQLPALHEVPASQLPVAVVAFSTVLLSRT